MDSGYHRLRRANVIAIQFIARQGNLPGVGDVGATGTRPGRYILRLCHGPYAIGGRLIVIYLHRQIGDTSDDRRAAGGLVFKIIKHALVLARNSVHIAIVVYVYKKRHRVGAFIKGSIRPERVVSKGWDGRQHLLCKGRAARGSVVLVTLVVARRIAGKHIKIVVAVDIYHSRARVIACVKSVHRVACTRLFSKLRVFRSTDVLIILESAT